MDILLFENYSETYGADKIICLSNFSEAELYLFIQVLENVEKGNDIVLSEQSFIYKKEVRLELRLNEVDCGITRLCKENFVCKLSRNTYENAIAMTKALLNNGMDGFQWLYDVDTSIDFLLSKEGKW